MPAVPALIMAGGSVVGSIAAGKARKSAQKQAMQRSPEEQALMDKQGGLQDQATAQGKQTFSGGMGQLRSTIDYYRSLLNGDRATRMNAVSGEAQDTADAYQGADVAANKTLRGGERDQAVAENARAKAGSVARLVTGVRPGAAAALTGIGQNLLSTSEGFSGQAANIGANLLGNSTDNRFKANEAGDKAAEGVGSAIGNITGLVAGGFGGAGGGGKSLSSITGNKSPVISPGSFTGRLPGAPLPPEVSY